MTMIRSRQTFKNILILDSSFFESGFKDRLKTVLTALKILPEARSIFRNGSRHKIEKWR